MDHPFASGAGPWIITPGSAVVMPATHLPLHHVAEGAQGVRQTFWLLDPVEGLSAITAPSIGHHEPGVVGREDLLDCRVAMTGANLGDGRVQSPGTAEDPMAAGREAEAPFACTQEAVERLLIDELSWEREDRTEPPVDEAPPFGTVSGALEDIIVTDQENRNFEPSAGPVQAEV